ncbi:T9SS type A sorting domain-containing protein [Hymenobacter sp. B81]|uniref:T9SS type A sorting domain-containing protein n=1 Tax=Hymenobacter sp. B81 TaxID=3344878 RepID=UPI0037DCBD13
MKKIFTLAAAGALATASLTAQAQITLDGVVNANEIGSAAAGQYVSLGAYNQPHPSGFGDWGLLRMYAANTSTKLYFFLAGTPENNGNGFHLYMDFPHLNRVPDATPLPTITGTDPAAPTMFEVKGTEPGVAGMVLDMPVDAALALKGDGANFIPQALMFTSATAGTATNLTPTIPTAAGAPQTINASATTGAFAPLAGMRMAFRTTSTGKVTDNPGAAVPNPGGAGSYGWEIEMDRAALGLPAGANVIRLFAGYVANSGYWSSDVIPEIPGNTTNLENTPDFSLEQGTQAATFNVVVTSSRQAAEAAVAMGVFPNPSADKTTITYQVLGKSQAVQVVLTDLMGRTVRTLHNGTESAGFHNLEVSKQDVSAGTYLVKVQVGDKAATRKVVLL